MLIVARETFEAALNVTLGPKAADHLIKGIFNAIILSACKFDFLHAPYQPSSVGWARGPRSQTPSNQLAVGSVATDAEYGRELALIIPIQIVAHFSVTPKPRERCPDL